MNTDQWMPADSTMSRVMIEVVAGVIPLKPMDEYTKRWAITEEGWQDKTGISAMQAYGLAVEYMRSLWNPQRVNWVQCTWIYL